MSIRPIDFQVTIPKSSEVAKINNNVRYEEAAQGFAKQLEKQTEKQMTQVVHSDNSEFNTVDKDGRNNNSREEAKKKDSDKEEDGKPKKNNKSTSIYDISI